MNGNVIYPRRVDNSSNDAPVAETIDALEQLSFPALVLVLLVLTRREELSPIARLSIMRMIERVLTSRTKRAA